MEREDEVSMRERLLEAQELFEDLCHITMDRDDKYGESLQLEENVAMNGIRKNELFERYNATRDQLLGVLCILEFHSPSALITQFTTTVRAGVQDILGKYMGAPIDNTFLIDRFLEETTPMFRVLQHEEPLKISKTEMKRVIPLRQKGHMDYLRGMARGERVRSPHLKEWARIAEMYGRRTGDFIDIEDAERLSTLKKEIEDRTDGTEVGFKDGSLKSFSALLRHQQYLYATDLVTAPEKTASSPLINQWKLDVLRKAKDRIVIEVPAGEFELQEELESNGFLRWSRLGELGSHSDGDAILMEYSRIED